MCGDLNMRQNTGVADPFFTGKNGNGSRELEYYRPGVEEVWQSANNVSIFPPFMTGKTSRRAEKPLANRRQPSYIITLTSPSVPPAVKRMNPVAKAAPRQLALAALARALNDPAAKVLHGSKAKPGVFDGSAQAAKEAARYCLDHGWLEATGLFEGKGRSRKELYRITPAGIQEALENAEPVALLKESVALLDKNTALFQGIKTRVEETLSLSTVRSRWSTLLWDGSNRRISTSSCTTFIRQRPRTIGWKRR